ncbi:MAG: hypothetical protein JXP73_19265 [Deltaproteobacteria bacterium]|nr:hypothetical protein [Deltaproteobacteria bacterium]
MIIPRVTALQPRLTPGTLVYRGFSDPDEYREAGRIGFTPEKPISPAVGANWLSAFHGAETLDHVRNVIRYRFKSFSLDEEIACYYATWSKKGIYHRQGWVAAYRLPVLQGLSAGGGEPEWYETPDGSVVWVDPRSLSPVAARSFPAWAEMRNLAQGDSEILLAKGTIRPVSIREVRPSDCRKTHRPWAGHHIEVL